jgi:hypothetical protein
VALLFGWGVAADEAAPGADKALVQYRVSLAALESDQLEIELPGGFEYVGPAVGSQITARPEVSRDGGSVVWDGPFPTTGELRFWLASLEPVPAPASLSVLGSDFQATRVEPQHFTQSRREPVSSTTSVPGALSVTKAVEPEELDLDGNMWWVTYEVIFTNTATETAVLDRVTDTLPADFIYGLPDTPGGDEAGYPVDDVEPEIVWEGLTVPASGTLTMRYNVRSVLWNAEASTPTRWWPW